MTFERGIYFLHKSFLKDMSDKWFLNNQVGKSAEVFMGLVASKLGGCVIQSCDRAVKDLFTCDRTMESVTDGSITLDFVPAVVGLISEQMLPNNTDLDDDIYSLKVASFRRISTDTIFFLVSDEEKTRIVELAQVKGYTLKIMSPEDFD